MLDLSGHDGAAHARCFESLNQLGKFAERKPVHRGGAVGLDFREGLFLDGGNHHVEALSPGRIEHQKGEAAVAGDQAESFSWGGHRGQCKRVRVALRRQPEARPGCPRSCRRYLITPRSEASINRISISTSFPASASAFSFSSACEVLSLEASRTL